MQITPLILSALQFVNCPYVWGANGPYEFDCSGLILKSLRDIGIRQKNGDALPDMTAQDIFRWSQTIGEIVDEVEHDCLIFYGKNLKAISHIALAVSPLFIIEAGGAGSDSLAMTPEELAKKDARVRIRPIHHRKDFLVAVKLSY